MYLLCGFGSKLTSHCEALVVDDNKVNVKVMTGMLTRRLVAPLAVCGEAQDGAVALKYLLNRSGCRSAPLIVFMDIQMPRMDGNECAKYWRELERSLKLDRAFLVAVRAGHAANVPDRFDAVLPKPIQLAGLKDLVDKWRSSLERLLSPQD